MTAVALTYFILLVSVTIGGFVIHTQEKRTLGQAIGTLLVVVAVGLVFASDLNMARSILSVGMAAALGILLAEVLVKSRQKKPTA